MTYSATLADLFRRNRRGIKPGLEATRDLAAALNVNLDALPMVLVAGTNGKGRYRPLLPIFAQAREFEPGIIARRISCDSQNGSRSMEERSCKEKVIELWERVRSIEPGLDHPPSFFEIATVMAHQFFQSRNVTSSSSR